MTIVFIGDIHQQWRHVEQGLASLEKTPRAAILLGDIQCDQPLDVLAAPLLDRGIAVHWLHGNHDNDGGPAMWANLTSPGLNPRTAPGALHGRVTEVAGLRVAALGGTFRPRIWNPPHGPRLHSRAGLRGDVMEQGKFWRPDHIEVTIHSLSTGAIWPEDVEYLATQRADILVTHEAPDSHQEGKAALAELARAMGASLIVHGHHHVTYHARADDGLRALGVASAWGVGLDGDVLWRGDAPRPPTAAPIGWSLEAEAATR